MVMYMRLLSGLAVIAISGLVLLSPIGGTAQEATPAVDPSQFSTDVTNLYFPLPVGALRIYEGEESDPESGETHEFRIEERVLAETDEVMGVDVVVLEVTEYEDGELIEVTRDYHAQHADGNVWYFGEDV